MCSGYNSKGMARASELIQEIVGLLQGDDDLQLEFARAFLTSRTLRRLFEADPELQDTLRRLILTDALLQLPETVEPLLQLPEKIEPLLQLPEKIEPLLQLPERVGALEAAVSELRAVVNRIEPIVNRIEPVVNRIEPIVNRIEPVVNRIEPIVNRIEPVVNRIEPIVNRIEPVVNRIEPIVNRIEPAVMELQRWQQGEVARRKGDDYERSVIQRAGRIFGLGQGGSPRDDASVRQQILLWLDAAGLLEEDEDPASDPLEADLVWWKGDRVALAEISVKVDRNDVRRAKLRAETLRRAGLTVTPVVIGSQWAHRQTPKIAQREGVESVVKGVYSQGVIDFRRYHPT
jgi:uncharacterized protein Yka (UPF0111/DUF47 family)